MGAKDRPKLEIAGVIAQATEGLKAFGWEIPSDMRLNRISYVLTGTWALVWQPVYAGVPEVKNEFDVDSIGVLFDDDGEEIRFSRSRHGPPPASIIPKLTYAEAVDLAAKAVPRILATESCRSQMAEPLDATQFRQADLCVTMPNWILDEERHRKILDPYIPERRLCWRAIFLLYRQNRTEGLSSLPVTHETHALLHVFLDAVTGEVVGGRLESLSNDPTTVRLNTK